MAIEAARWPLQWDQPQIQGTPNFLGIPEVSLAPDIVLLPWLGNTSFVLLHTLLCYSIGCVGLLWLARTLNASVMASIVLWGLFNFNGYITVTVQGVSRFGSRDATACRRRWHPMAAVRYASTLSRCS